MAQPWHSMDTLPHFYVRRPAPGCLLLAGPRRKAATELISYLRECERVKLTFCGYLFWWMVEGDPVDVRTVGQVVGDCLKPWRLPDEWMEAASWDAIQGESTRSFWTTPDGYRAWMPRDAEMIRAVRNVQTEFGDDAHLEWMADGFEWVLRRKEMHRRIRATFKAHGFRPRSPILNVLRETQARSGT